MTYVVDGEVTSVLTPVFFQLFAHYGSDGLRVHSSQLRLLLLLVKLQEKLQQLSLVLLMLLQLLLLLLLLLQVLPLLLLLLLLQPEMALEKVVEQRLGGHLRRSSVSQAWVGGLTKEITSVVFGLLALFLQGELLTRRVHDVVDGRHHDVIAVRGHDHPG